MADHKQEFLNTLRCDAQESKDHFHMKFDDYVKKGLSRLIRDWQSQFPDAPTYEEGRAVVEEVYGLRLPKPAPAVVTNTRDFAKKEVKEPEVMLEVAGSESPVIHHPSLGEVHAFRGVGKTNFTIGFCNALATGSEFLCYKATRPFNCIYVDGEMDAGDMQEQLGILAEENENFNLITRCEQQNEFMPSIATAEGLAWYEEAINRSKAEVVVFDNWSRLANIGTNDEDSFFQFTDWCVRMRLRGVTVIYLHHDGKDKHTQRGHSKPEDPLNWVIGLRWSGDYKGQEGLKCVLEFEKARKPIYEFSKISLELSDGVWCWGKDKAITPTTGRPPIEATEEQKEQLKALVAEGKGERTIAKEIGISRDLARRWKAELLGKKEPQQADITFDGDKETKA
ncbi:MAG TPA: AAA family ATPase [Candidatus Sulfotelmatobacter sp.]|nr:AAA family ATPase [Candidatus Sulfotelmatobacter sp.]